MNLTKSDLKKIDAKLHKELNRLKELFDFCHELTVKYRPDDVRYSQNNNIISGEVNGTIILIYEPDENMAIATLHHEFIEYLLNSYFNDYIDVINEQNKFLLESLNNQKKLLNKFFYKRREELVERLRKSISI